MTITSTLNIFWLEDDKEFVRIKKDYLNRKFDKEFVIARRSSYESGVAFFEESGLEEFSLIILDIQLEGDETGLDFYKFVREKNPYIPVAFFSASENIGSYEEELDKLKTKYFDEPIEIKKGGADIELLSNLFQSIIDGFQIVEDNFKDFGFKEFVQLDKVARQLATHHAIPKFLNFYPIFFQNNPEFEFVYFWFADQVPDYQEGTIDVDEVSHLMYGENARPFFYYIQQSEDIHEINHRISNFIEKQIHLFAEETTQLELVIDDDIPFKNIPRPVLETLIKRLLSADLELFQTWKIGPYYFEISDKTEEDLIKYDIILKRAKNLGYLNTHLEISKNDEVLIRFDLDIGIFRNFDLNDIQKELGKWEGDEMYAIYDLIAIDSIIKYLTQTDRRRFENLSPQTINKIFDNISPKARFYGFKALYKALAKFMDSTESVKKALSKYRVDGIAEIVDIYQGRLLSIDEENKVGLIEIFNAHPGGDSDEEPISMTELEKRFIIEPSAPLEYTIYVSSEDFGFPTIEIEPV